MAFVSVTTIHMPDAKSNPLNVEYVADPVVKACELMNPLLVEPAPNIDHAALSEVK